MFKVKSKLTLHQSGWLGAYLVSALFASPLGWRSVFSEGQRVDISGRELLLDCHSFLALPAKEKKKEPLTKLKTSGCGCVPIKTLFLENRNLNFIDFHTSQSRIILVT